MNRQEAKRRARQHESLVMLGVSPENAESLRRISLTLRSWFEGECGTSRGSLSWVIERDGDEPDSKPFSVTYWPDGRTTRHAIPDRETGARKRLTRILSETPTLTAYIQGDPRGPSLYILKPGDVPEGQPVKCHYTRGLAVY